MLVGAILAAHLRHAGPAGTLLAVLIGIVLAALNLWMVHKVGALLASHTRSTSERSQDLQGKAFCVVCLAWVGVAEFVGYRLVAAILNHTGA